MQTEQLKIEFPVSWEYRIVALYNPEMIQKIKDLLATHGFQVEPIIVNISTKKTYATYEISVLLYNRQILDSLSSTLADAPFVKFLL